MGAFGYEPSYQMKTGGPSMGAPTMSKPSSAPSSPGYMGSSYQPMSGLDFNPAANPNMPMNGAPGAYAYYGGQNTPNLASAHVLTPDYYKKEKGNKAFSQGKFYALPGNTIANRFSGENALYEGASGPKYFADLEKQISGMSIDQLQALDSAGKYRSQFQMAAQDYSNAFSNPVYAGITARQGSYDTGDYGSNSRNKYYQGARPEESKAWTQPNVSNWLEGSYNNLVGKLNDAWLL